MTTEQNKEHVWKYVIVEFLVLLLVGGNVAAARVL